MIFKDIFIQPLTVKNSIVPNGLMYFFKAGTYNKVEIYSDDDYSVITSNPAVANESGIFSSVYLKNEEYDIYITNGKDWCGGSNPDIQGDIITQKLNYKVENTSKKPIKEYTSITKYYKGDILSTPANSYVIVVEDFVSSYEISELQSFVLDSPYMTILYGMTQNSNSVKNNGLFLKNASVTKVVLTSGSLVDRNGTGILSLESEKEYVITTQTKGIDWDNVDSNGHITQGVPYYVFVNNSFDKLYLTKNVDISNNELDIFYQYNNTEWGMIDVLYFNNTKQIINFKKSVDNIGDVDFTISDSSNSMVEFDTSNLVLSAGWHSPNPPIPSTEVETQRFGLYFKYGLTTMKLSKAGYLIKANTNYTFRCWLENVVYISGRDWIPRCNVELNLFNDNNALIESFSSLDRYPSYDNSKEFSLTFSSPIDTDISLEMEAISSPKQVLRGDFRFSIEEGLPPIEKLEDYSGGFFKLADGTNSIGYKEQLDINIDRLPANSYNLDLVIQGTGNTVQDSGSSFGGFIEVGTPIKSKFLGVPLTDGAKFTTGTSIREPLTNVQKQLYIKNLVDNAVSISVYLVVVSFKIKRSGFNDIL